MSLALRSTIKYLTLQEAAKRYPPIEGRVPHISAIWRQARKGILARNGQRIRLEHTRVGRRVLIPEGAVERFLDAVAAADAAYFDRPAHPAATPAPKASQSLRRKQLAAAEAACAARGI